MKDKLAIPFKLVNIEENQFSVFEENLDDSSPINQKIGVGFGADFHNRIIGSTFRFQLNKEKNPLLKIEATCYFEIEENSFPKLLSDNKIILPCKFAKHLAVITTGTVRGILYANTKGTAFNEFFLGLIDIDNMFVKDIILEV